jgi:hypothetical protein
MSRAVEPRRAAPSEERRIPRAAVALGALSAVPFVAAAAIILWSESQALRLYGHVALVSYGACVLSFLGAVHAGLALREAPLPAARLIVAAGAPALAWLSLALGERAGLLAMAAGFLATLAYDIAAARRDWAPAWYPRLRWPLTGVALASLLIALQFAPV